MEEFSVASFALRIGVVLILVAANGFFVAAEFALVASRRTRIEAMVRRGDRKARTAQKAIQSLDRYISGTQLGITVASLSLGWLGEPALASLFDRFFSFLPAPLDAVGTHAVAVAIAFAIITFLHIVLGELAPKALALLHPELVSRWVAGPLIVLTEACSPFIWLLNGTANQVLRLVGLRTPSESERVHSPEEIVMLVKQTERSGHLAKGDVRLIEGVFEFTEKTAKDVMTPRTDMITFSSRLRVDEAIRRVASARRSRYPVYGESPDDITGFVHVQDLVAALGRRPEEAVGTFVREPLFVPGTSEVEDVLAQMKHQKVQLAMVLDEYGGTAGLVTLEDLLEEIVGPIFGEYDVDTAVGQLDADAFPGDLPVAVARQRLGVEIDDGRYLTVGGWVFGVLGRLPRAGDRVPVRGGALEVLEMKGRRVGRLRFLRLEPDSERPDAGQTGQVGG